MRHLLLVLPLLALAGCKDDVPPQGAVRATVSYSGFLPGCVLVVARDTASGQELSTSVQGKGTRENGGSVVVGIFPPKDWGTSLEVEARAFEQTCDGASVVSTTTPVTLTPSQVSEVPLALSAKDEDRDGYVSILTGGTDCKDSAAAIHPGAEERCNDLDDNCDGQNDGLGDTCMGANGCQGFRACGPSGSVVCNSPEPQLAYPDQDGDGHGVAGAPAQSFCTGIPAGYVVAAGHANDDCDDTRRTVYPGAAELCDTLDNDCNNQADETFQLSQSCDPTSGCDGVWACDSQQQGRTCVAQRAKPTWYQDDDEDGYGNASTPVQACQQPAHYVAQAGDCNDGNPFTHDNATELCDSEDNDCSGQAEAKSDCSGNTRDWISTTVGGDTGRTWTSISLWGDHGVWVVGTNSGRAVKKPGDTGFTELTTGCGVDWLTVWASPSGTAYMGGTGRSVVSQTPTSTTCPTQQVQAGTAQINGIWGIPGSGNPQLFGVGDQGGTNGFIFPWDGSTAPGALGTTALPLYEVQGRLPTGPLFAVGGGGGAPTIYRYDFMMGQWVQQTGVPDTNDIDNLYAVSVVNDRLAFAGGENGAFLKWDGNTWAVDTNTFTTERITGIEAFGASSIYVVTMGGKIFRYNGSSWTRLKDLTGELRFIRGTSPEDIWAAGDGRRIIHWPK